MSDRCLEIIEAYQFRPDIIQHLNDVDLSAVKQALHNKRNLPEYKVNCRKDVTKKIERNVAEDRKHELAKIQAEGIHHELSKDFSDIEYYWKNIRDLREDYKYRRANELLKKRGRKVGQVLYDYTPLPTNLYSVKALLNIYNGRAQDNTEEHFTSLHSNAGPSILEEAISIGIKYDIPDYAYAVYKNVHTVVTTKHENNLLREHHKNNKMINPQISYNAVGMSVLIEIPKPPTRTKLAWGYLFKTLKIQPKTTHPFTSVLPLECVVEQYLDIDAEKLKAALKIT